MAIPYEPYASFVYLSLWTHSSGEWLTINALDDGVTLCRWGDAQVRAAWVGMTDEDKAAVETHRQRSFGRNPIDDTSHQEVPDIDHLLVEVKP
jgi:hypothetical protein